MNRYSYEFEARCPSDGDLVRYSLEMVSAQRIMAEEIVSACTEGTATPVFHEDLADQLARKFGGSHTLSATHRGVKIVTMRGPHP